MHIKTTSLAASAAFAALLAVGSASAPAFAQNQNTKAKTTAAAAKVAAPITHKIAIQVNENEPKTMNLALNNVQNLQNYYKGKGENVLIEVVTYGPGLHMLRADTSPVKARISTMSLESPNIRFVACGNTRENMSKAEAKEIALVGEAQMVPSGVVTLLELQEKGYAYLRP
jgi:hypothetical protein